MCIWKLRLWILCKIKSVISKVDKQGPKKNFNFAPSTTSRSTLKWILSVKKLHVYLFFFRTTCINFPYKRHFINKMEGIINIIHISLQSKCSTCSRSCKNDQTCNNAYRKWRGYHNFRFTRYLRPLLNRLKILVKFTNTVR